MAKWEVKKLFEIRQGRYLPCGLNIIEKMWWRFMPGTVINVKWPVGEIVVVDTDPRWDWSLGATFQSGTSADPNDHYRPWMEANVGRQKWDWDWGLVENDTIDNRLTIKFKRGKENQAMIAAMRWA